MRQLLDLGVTTVTAVDIKADDTVIKALKKDPAHDEEEALKDIYRRLRPGDPPTVANARALLKRLFFDPKKYDLGRVGRYKINQKLSLETDLTKRILEPEDFIASMKYLIGLRRGDGHARRHRPSRQPPRADRGRTARQPVPRGPRPHGASGQGAHDPVRRERRRHDAPEAHQPEGAQRGHPRFLRPFAVEPVHGPDQPLGRTDAQAPVVRPRAGRSEPRPRRFRGARRASLATTDASAPSRRRKARTSG